MGSRRATLLAGVLLVALVATAYRNSLRGPCIFDDGPSIAGNPTIQRLWPIGPVLSPPAKRTVTGRPLVNLTLALNYAAGGLDVYGYHAVNVTLHILASLTLFGVVLRTLQAPRLRGRYGAAALPLAMAVALVWALHPLQTESVTYLIQRAEALAGLFYLLTLYAVFRSADAAHPRRWHLLAVVCCLLGVASKEVIVTAPVVVLLYDRTFLSGSFREAWRRRRGLYLALASTWLLLAYLVLLSAGRGGSAGFGTGISPWRYALTQAWAITHYLQLTLWPSPLILDYGTWLAPGLRSVWPAVLLIVLLLASTAVATWRRPVLGFLGVWFFACLAPTSSFIPVATQTIAEHRMYLALAAPVALAVVGTWDFWCRLPIGPSGATSNARRLVCLAPLLALALTVAALGMATAGRNNDYRSAFAIWQDTVAKRLDNARAHHNLGRALAGQGEVDQAVAQYQKAVELKPDFAEAHKDLGVALLGRGQVDQAIAHFQKAVDIRPGYAEAHCIFGNALLGCGQIDQAIAHYQEALEIQPDYAEANFNLGLLLANRGQTEEAIAHYQKVLEIRPDRADAHNNLGAALGKVGRTAEAIAQFQKALEIQPDFAKAHCNLGVALMDRGQVEEAIAQFQKALEIQPDCADAQRSLKAIQTQRR
jgi:tetratricopeptide (TPR) repeat protein